MAIGSFIWFIESKKQFAWHLSKFQRWTFSFQKSNREFLSIALRQVHEQNNAVLKSAASATHILNRQDESALLRWELCSHDLAKYLKDSKDVCSQTNLSICHQSTTEHHHEDTVAFKDRFINDLQQLNNSFSANPFTAHTWSPIDNLSIVYDDEIESNIKNIVDIGQRQFECYFEERLIKAKTPIDATIKSNSLRLPGKNFTVKKSKVEQSLTAANISTIKSSYQFRCEEVCNLFKEELFSNSTQHIRRLEYSLSRNKVWYFKETQLHWKTKFKSRKSRSSRPEVFCKKGVLRNFTKFTEKHLCQSLFSNKVAGLSQQLY